MVVDRKAFPWALGAGAVLLASGVWYARYAAAAGAAGISGGSWPGLAFGSLGSLMIVYCMLLSARKALRTAPLGRAQAWMQAHVWLGLVSYPIIWFHAGFRTGGSLTTLLMVLFTLVWLSGIAGLVFQQAVPRRITSGIPNATVREQIAHVVAGLRADAEAVVTAATARAAAAAAAAQPAGAGAAAGGGAAGGVLTGGVMTAGTGRVGAAAGDAAGPGTAGTEAAAALRAFYAGRVAPLLQDPIPAAARPTRGGRATDDFAALRFQLPETLREAAAELEDLVRQRLQLDRQRRLHRYLHGWLLVHVPLSWALLILSGIHAVMALRYTTVG